jgi:Carboxypeptidase regulatory-like domain
MNSHLRRIVFATAFLFLSAVCFHSTMIGKGTSSPKGGLAGVIADPSGAVIPHAKVTVSGQTDTRWVTTNDDGRFGAGDLTPGLYLVTVEREGFSSTIATNIEVVIGRNSSLNLTMKPGASAETVEVDDRSHGAVGRTASNFGLDLHTSYPVPAGKKFKLILSFDVFNVTKPLQFQRARIGCSLSDEWRHAGGRRRGEDDGSRTIRSFAKE